MSSSEFARKQLEKHGWKKGSGLGKQEHGRCDPIKVNLKMDKTGVGHDPGKEFTDHWWLRVFNDAAKKIGTKQQTKKKSDGEKKMDRKQAFYAGFVKSATLTNGVEEKEEKSEASSSEDETTDAQSVPTLNDIHKFCGGATGHKAARFGIKMGGKLARVAKHDQMVAERLQKSSNLPATAENVTTPAVDADSLPQQGSPSEKGKKKKKKKEKKSRMNESEEVLPGEENGDESDIVVEKKKKKKSQKLQSSELPSVEIGSCNGAGGVEQETCEVSEDAMSSKKKKKKDVKNCGDTTVESEAKGTKRKKNEEENEEETVKRKKKKKSSKKLSS